MFISKCISVLLSAILTTNSVAVWVTPVRSQVEVEVEVLHDNIVEEGVEAPAVDIYEEPVQEDVPTELAIEDDVYLTEDEIDLIALVTMAEAEGEPEEGKRLVIDVILNRLDSPRFSDTIEGVIYSKNAFECMWNGRVDRCYVREDIRQLVIEEIESRTNSNIHYFRTDHYHNFGVPVLSVGNHYFSTY